MDEKMLEMPKDETDLSYIMNKRMERINDELMEFNGLISDFAYAVDSEMENFTVNMGHLQKNLNRVHMMKVGETSDNTQARREKDSDGSNDAGQQN